MDELRDPTGGTVDLSGNAERLRHEVRGLTFNAAFNLFQELRAKKYAVSLKHLGGYYFVEVPVGLRGDPCFGKTAEIQTLALRAGCKTIQTGNTLRIIG